MRRFSDKIKVILFLGTFFGLFLFGSFRAYAGDELYFNENGDLIFSAYDKKATSGVKYQTVGWVLKRYRDDINAAGQYSVNLPKSGYMYTMEDPYQPGYIYTTFIMDGEAVGDLIKKASAAWYDQLKKYGGYLYIDSIMTVTEQGAAQGGVDWNGVLYGEVYCSYQGIRYAREWGDGDKLAAYYDLKTRYPYKPSSYSYQLITMDTKDKTYNSGNASYFQIGSNEAGKEIYDVSQGIPSGEELYLKGGVDAFCYEVHYQEVLGRAMVPVRVSTTYRLSWCDTKGYMHTEDQTVVRCYYVMKDFKIQKIKDATVYSLKEVNAESGCFSKCQLGTYRTQYSCKVTRQGSDLSSYISIPKDATVDVGIVYVHSTNYQRPDIPNDNQQALANNVSISYQTRSDSLEVNNKILLSGTWKNGNAATLQAYTGIPKYMISKKNIRIPKETKNQSGYQSRVYLFYENGNKKKQFSHQLSSITVHTPVVAGLEAKSGKEYNQSLYPLDEDVVVGEKLLLTFSEMGTHRPIQGYGTGDYRKYWKNGYVRFPFPVEKNKTVYEAGTWIAISQSEKAFIVPEYVSEGSYEAEYVVAAYNVPSQIQTVGQMLEVAGNGANLNLQQYCARSSVTVHVIGKMHDLSLEKEEQNFTVSQLPVGMKSVGESDSIWYLNVLADSVGDDASEYLEADISYYILEKTEEGYQKKEVDVYQAESESFSGSDLKKLQEHMQMPAENALQKEAGIYAYREAFFLPKYIVVVEKGTDVGNLDIYSEDLIKNQTLLVHMDVYASDRDGRKLSYENSSNEKKGYCNMWKKEGYNCDSHTGMKLAYGDVLLVDTTGLIRKSVQVIGTH